MKYVAFKFWNETSEKSASAAHLRFRTKCCPASCLFFGRSSAPTPQAFHGWCHHRAPLKMLHLRYKIPAVHSASPCPTLSFGPLRKKRQQLLFSLLLHHLVMELVPLTWKGARYLRPRLSCSFWNCRSGEDRSRNRFWPSTQSFASWMFHPMVYVQMLAFGNGWEHAIHPTSLVLLATKKWSK